MIPGPCCVCQPAVHILLTLHFFRLTEMMDTCSDVVVMRD